MCTNKAKIPFFSIIVPTYNNEKELKKCVDSILEQTYQDFELILVDDGSTDSTASICDQFLKRDSRINVIHKRNEGVAAARNTGLFQARGKYVYYVDADDWIERQLLWEAVCILNRFTDLDMFVFGIKMIVGENQTISYPCFVEPGLYQKKRLEYEIYPRMMRQREKRVWMPVVSSYLCDKIILRELLMEHYCRDTSLFMGEESVCAYECLYYARQVYFSPLMMYSYNRLSESSMHRRYHEDLFENSIRLARYYRTYLGKGNQDIEHQINIRECRNLRYVIEHELEFGSSIYDSSVRLNEKIKQMRKQPICPLDGLSFFDKCFIILLSLRLQYLILLSRKSAIVTSVLWKKIKSQINKKKGQ